jgi:hypothetical protein
MLRTVEQEFLQVEVESLTVNLFGIGRIVLTSVDVFTGLVRYFHSVGYIVFWFLDGCTVGVKFVLSRGCLNGGNFGFVEVERDR